MKSTVDTSRNNRIAVYAAWLAAMTRYNPSAPQGLLAQLRAADPKFQIWDQDCLQWVAGYLTASNPAASPQYAQALQTIHAAWRDLAINAPQVYPISCAEPWELLAMVAGGSATPGPKQSPAGGKQVRARKGTRAPQASARVRPKGKRHA